MAEGLNRVMLLGNLGADPELRFTQGGQAVLKLRLATNESYVDRDGARKDRTEWHNVVVWGKRAEALGKFLTRGSSLFVEGSLRTSSWEGQDGQKRYRTEVTAREIILVGGRGRGGGGGGGGGGPQAESPMPPDYGPPPQAEGPGYGPEGGAAGGGGAGGAFGADEDEDDVPF
jgi:single-strand DNA-binding protein